MAQPPALHLAPPPFDTTPMRVCRKCGGADVVFTKHKRDNLCVGCNRKIVREWEAAHPDRVRTRKAGVSARFRQQYPERVMFSSAKARARKEGVPCTICDADIQIPPCCPVLGIPLQRTFGRGGGDASPSLDRIVPEKGYVVGNIAVISSRANRIKSNATADEIERVVAWLRSTLRG